MRCYLVDKKGFNLFHIIERKKKKKLRVDDVPQLEGGRWRGGENNFERNYSESRLSLRKQISTYFPNDKNNKKFVSIFSGRFLLKVYYNKTT